MYCCQCGTHLPDNARFCPNCGSVVDGKQPSEPSLSAQGIQPEKNKSNRKRSKKSVIAIAAVIVLILLIPFAKQILFGGAAGDPMRSSDPVDPYERGNAAENTPPAEETNVDYTIVSIPDLEHYFGMQNLSEDNQTERFSFDIDPRDAVRNYVKLLQSKYGIVLAESYEDDAVVEWVMHHKDAPDAPFSITADRAGDGMWEVNCRLNSLTLQSEWEVWEWPKEDNPEPIPEPTLTPTPELEVTAPSVLPGFLANDSSGRYTFWEESSDHKLTFEALDFDAAYVAEEYVELLTNMGYTVVYTEQDDHSSSLGGEMLIWELWHNAVSAAALRSGSTGQVRVKINSYTAWDKCTVVVEFSDGITMENFSGGTGSDSSDNDFFATCSSCHGSGKCTHCNGKGEVQKFQAGLGWVDQDCTLCNRGKCRHCNGTGKS